MGNDDDRRTAEPTDDLNLALNPTNYKVRGRIADDDATGVFGHATAGSGRNRGVLGRVDSSVENSTGVYGESTAGSGETYGVYALTESEDSTAAGLRAMSTSGRADAIEAESLGRGHGLNVQVDGNGNYGVWARNTGKAGTSNDHGVVGDTYTAADGVAGVVGRAQDDDNNRTYGVKGLNDAATSVSTNPAGVYGEANPSAGSGAAYGVHGYNDWLGTSSSAVRGEDEAGGFGFGLTYGVYGTTSNPFGTGVKGEALFDSTDAYGVVGASISGRGVYGETNSTSGYGVYASAPGTAGPAMRADGTVSKNANATAYLTSNQTINGTTEYIAFDGTTGDDFGAIVTDTTASNTGAYVAPTAGDYRVDLHLQWNSSIDYNNFYAAYVELNGIQVVQDLREVAGDAGQAFAANTVSKVLMNLDQGDTIRAQAYNSVTKDLDSGIDATFMSVSHVG